MAQVYTRTGMAELNLGNRSFEVNATLCYRGGYIWVPKGEDLRCCARLLVGITEAEALEWARKDAAATNTPSDLMHAVLFDVPLSKNWLPEEAAQLRRAWIRITDNQGKVFGVKDAKYLVATIHSNPPTANRQYGLYNIKTTLDEEKANKTWPTVADRISNRYLSGLEPEDESWEDTLSACTDVQDSDLVHSYGLEDDLSGYELSDLSDMQCDLDFE